MPFKNTNRAIFCAFSLLSYCLPRYAANIQPIALCFRSEALESFALCIRHLGAGRMVGMAVCLPFIVLLSFFHWLPSSSIFFCPLIYAFSTRCSGGCHSVPLSSSSRVSQLPVLPASAWTDQPQTLHESLSGNSGNCNLLGLEFKEKNTSGHVLKWFTQHCSLYCI